MKTFNIIFFLVLNLLMHPLHAQIDKPNIIFILADDLGYSELSSYGNTFNETPHLDQLASEGTRFTQAYAAAPVCSPYRAALITGQYPARVGINDYLRSWSDIHLDTAHVTIAEALQQNGYRTGIIGKWHLTGYKAKDAPVEVSPDQHGFDEVISSETTGIANGTYFHPYHFNPELEKKILSDEQEFLVDRMNLEAVEFIEKNKDEPFFLYLSHYAVHTMLHGEPEWVDHFRKKENSGTSPPGEKNSEDNPYNKRPSDYFAQENNPHLAAQLKVIDEGVGMIRNKLKDLKLHKNTIIIFTSDNGGESRVTSNKPLREGKSTTYEGGIRVPLIVYHPDYAGIGKVSGFITSTYDYYSTLCEMTSTAIPPVQHQDGVSFLPALYDDEFQVDRALFWHYPLEKRHFLGGRSSGAIRYGDWKLIELFDTDQVELYNLRKDVGEVNDVSNFQSEMTERLMRKLLKWRQEVLE